jgi:hypothetical protein
LESNLLEKVLLSFDSGCIDCLFKVLGKLRLHNNVIVKVIFDELGTLVSAMPIEDPKNLNLGPVWNPWLSLLRLDHIQNDRDSILIGFPDRANIGICGKRSNCAKGLRWDFTRLKLLQGGLLLGFGSLDQLVDLLLQDGVFSLFWTLDLGLGLFKRAHYLKLTWVVSGRFRSWSLLFLERGRVKVIRLILILRC